MTVLDQPRQKTTIHQAVQKRYATAIANITPITQATDDCCTPADCCGSDLYTVNTDSLPAEITNLSLGCGDPIAIASLEPAQTVLDLGSGAGMDVFLAAERVGPTGRVIGVDMTPEMLAKAEANRDKLGVQNVTFRQGLIENLPVESDMVDVIISNCVINLSPDKPAVFREAFRVLRPGGRLAVSDMVTQGRFSPAERADLDGWAACVTSAEEVGDLVTWLQAAGFTDISIRDKGAPDIELAGTISLNPAPRLFSALIRATKPAG